MKDINSSESLIWMTVCDAHMLAEMSNGGFQMDNCHELVMAHTKCCWKLTQQQTCKRHKMDPTKNISGSAGHSLSFQPPL